MDFRRIDALIRLAIRMGEAIQILTATSGDKIGAAAAIIGEMILAEAEKLKESK